MESQKIKIEQAIRREDLSIDAIRFYPRIHEMTYNINSTIESGETPRLLVKVVYSPKRQTYEIEIAFLGRYHTETVDYYKKNPVDWVSWGEIVLNAEKLRKLIEILARMEKEIPSQEVSLGQVQTKLVLQATVFDLSRIMHSLELARLLLLFEPDLSHMLKAATHVYYHFGGLIALEY